MLAGLSACMQADREKRTEGAVAPAASKPTYLVTVTPLALVLNELCGERAEVRVLLPAGANAHTYDPAPADVQAIARATAFFWVGPDYDGWAAEFETGHPVE